MSKKLIEMVCTGNNGRSPVAELIGQNYLLEVGADRDYATSSSGTMVSKIKAGGFPLKGMVPIVEMGKGRAIYGAEQLVEVDEALRTGNTAIIERYFKQASDIFAQEEATERDRLLGEFWIRGTVKSSADQTVQRADVIAVLSMDRKNYTNVVAIYQGSEHTPIISVLSALAMGDPLAEVPNSFGQGVAVYRQRVEQLMKDVPLAVRKIVGA